MICFDGLEPRRLLAADFGVNGLVSINLPGGEDTLPLHARAADGKLIFAGAARKGFAIVRLNADGTRDFTFDGDGVRYFNTTTNWSEIAIDPTSGRIALVDPHARTVRIFRANGSFDTQWAPNGIRTLASVVTGQENTDLHIAYGHDGRLLVASATYSDVAASGRANIAAYRRDGSLDPAFGTGGVASFAAVTGEDDSVTPYHIAVAPDGSITVFLVRTSYQTYTDSDDLTISSTADHSSVIRLSAAGATIGSEIGNFSDFNTSSEYLGDAMVGSSTLSSATLAAEVFYSKTYDFGEYALNIPYTVTLAAASATSPATSIRLTFDNRGERVRTATSNDGKIYLYDHSTITRYTADLVIDTTWANDGKLTFLTPIGVDDLIVDTDGQSTLFGTREDVDGTTVAAVARFDADDFFTPAGSARLIGIGTLKLRGTAAVDVITLRRKGSRLVMTINGIEQSFPMAGIYSVDLDAGEGNDRIFIKAASGKTSISGGGGDDFISVEAAGVSAYGGEGNDRLVAADDVAATLIGQAGDDRLVGSNAPDSLSGGDGDDRLYALAGNDTLFGGGGRDQLFAGDGNDFLDSGGGIDHLYGGTGDDTLHAGPGDDFCFGQTGDDYLLGDDGIDLLNGGPGTDAYYRYYADTLVSIEVRR